MFDNNIDSMLRSEIDRRDTVRRETTRTKKMSADQTVENSIRQASIMRELNDYEQQISFEQMSKHVLRKQDPKDMTMNALMQVCLIEEDITNDYDGSNQAR